MDKEKRKEKIQSLSELRLQQEKLKMEMRVTRNAIFNSLGNTSNSTRDYVINNFLLPAGLTTLATFVLSKWFTNEEEAGAESQNGGSHEDNPIRDMIRSIAEYILVFYQGNSKK